MSLLDTVLSKIARRYELKGCLSGTMKIGQDLGCDAMTELGNFFGLTPLRVNKKEELRLYFKDLLQNGSESQWLEKIGEALGHSLTHEIGETASNTEATRRIYSSLSLAFPALADLFRILKEDGGGLGKMLLGRSEEEVRQKCFTTAETIQFLLQNNTVLTVSDLGARFYHNSKTLRQGEMRSLLLRWLALCSPDLDGADEAGLLARYHVVHDRLTVSAVLYGPIIYEKDNKRYDWIDQLYRAGEAATLGWSNIQGMDKIYFRGGDGDSPELITCENEAPFSLLMQGNRNCNLLFTRGFPGSAVQKLYRLLAPQAANCLHWGDSDPAGLRIAALLHGIHPLQLYRCDLATLQRCRKDLLPLTQKQENSCLQILSSRPDFPFPEEMLFGLENGWLEQESWRKE
jgi:hypothetical protein